MFRRHLIFDTIHFCEGNFKHSLGCFNNISHSGFLISLKNLPDSCGRLTQQKRRHTAVQLPILPVAKKRISNQQNNFYFKRNFHMHNLVVAITIYFSTLIHPSSNFEDLKISSGDSLSHIVKEFLMAKENSYQEKATALDVETFLNFCTDNVQYDHVLSENKKFSFTGKDEWRNGSLSHLGETRNARIEITKYIERQNIVIVEYDLYREVKTNEKWEKDSTRTVVSIIEFDAEKKIKKITEYL